MWPRFLQSRPALQTIAPSGDGCQILEVDGQQGSFAASWTEGVSLFVPDACVASYAYPLICFLHGNEGSERDLWNWFPGISDQNYLGLGVRAPFPAASALPGRYRWRANRPDATLAVIRDAIHQVRCDWNVHPDRIVLLGTGSGAVIALQQLILAQLSEDDDEPTFRGAILQHLPPCWPRLIPPVLDRLRGRILLLDPEIDGEARAAVDCLIDLGMDISCPDDVHVPQAMLINHWMMSAISTAIF